MKSLAVKYSRGQLKIQQMAFVLVALMIVLGISFIFYLSFKTSSIRNSAEDIRELRAQEMARKFAGSPEIAYTSRSCASCADFDKAFVLKEKALNKTDYLGLWNSPLIQVKKLEGDTECTRQNYPNCSIVTVVKASGSFTSVDSFVAVCNYDSTIGKERCDLGKIVIGVKRA